MCDAIHKPDLIIGIIIPFLDLFFDGFCNQFIKLAIALSFGDSPVINNFTFVSLVCQNSKIADIKE